MKNVYEIVDHALAKSKALNHYSKMARDAFDERELVEETKKVIAQGIVCDTVHEMPDATEQKLTSLVLSEDALELGRLIILTVKAEARAQAEELIELSREDDRLMDHASLTDGERNGFNGLSGKL